MNAVSHYCCRNIFFCDFNTTFAILPAILQTVFTVFRRWCSWIPYILVSLQYSSVSLIFLNLVEWLQTSLRFTWWYINPASLPNPAQTIRYSSCLHNLQPGTLLNERLTAVDAPEIRSGLYVLSLSTIMSGLKPHFAAYDWKSSGFECVDVSEGSAGGSVFPVCSRVSTGRKRSVFIITAVRRLPFLFPFSLHFLFFCLFSIYSVFFFFLSVLYVVHVF